ncbi:hypothetical protein DL95DRAFT_445238 [Leptodontidium sp. 2 PMI_412]|nr:hypothetical protein DL95DRAFT_445238 [Leptodontidium sp. 2 PMI_412]
MVMLSELKLIRIGNFVTFIRYPTMGRRKTVSHSIQESSHRLGQVATKALSNRSKLRLSHAKWVSTPTLNSTYPPLKRTKADQDQYELFLREVLDTYGPRDGDDAEHGDGGSVVRVNTDSEKSYIDFEVGEYPHLPRRCEHFLLFSSKVSGSLLAQPYIQGAKQIHDVSRTSVCENADLEDGSHHRIEINPGAILMEG